MAYRKMLRLSLLGAAALPANASAGAQQQTGQATAPMHTTTQPTASDAPRLEDDGTVRYSPTLSIPFSGYASQEGKEDFVAAARIIPPGTAKGNPFAAERMIETRKWYDDQAKIGAEGMQTLYPVNVTRQMIGGVQTDVVTPAGGVAPANAHRVLINLHGGGFVFGARWIGLTESIPVASVGKLKVVTVDYRMGPEYKFPAASEDVAKVYAALLRDYRPENIGIYGCSAGGVLTMQSVAWFQIHGLPAPGAIGVNCAGGTLSNQGDSSYIGTIFLGRNAPPLKAPSAPYRALYFQPGDESNPLAAPIYSPERLAKYPPTLLVSATRDFALSNSLATHRALVNAGVEADLHVFDGLQHAFFYSPRSPEAREVYQITANFFMRHLGNKAKGK